MSKFYGRKFIFYFLLVSISLFGLFLRLREIDQRPMHGDEANQAYQFQLLFEEGKYRFEPKDFHGPTLYYLTLPFTWFSGLDKFANSEKENFRIVPVFFSILLGLGGLLFIDVLGRKGVLFYNLFIMLSPAMVFYSTYYIQEILLVCFSVYFAGSMWRFWCKPGLIWAISSGVFLGLMHATKETFVIFLFAFAVGFLVVYRGKIKRVKNFLPKHFISFGFSALFISVLFYSSFLKNPEGPVDSVIAFKYQIQRGLGIGKFEERFTSAQGHKKPATYYLSLLLGNYPRKFTTTIKDIVRNSAARPITEILFLLLPIFGCLIMPNGKSRSGYFFLALLLGVSVMILIYSLIPYKTPWCMLSFLCGFILLSAMTMRFLFERQGNFLNYCLILIIGFLVIDLGRQSILVNAEEFCVTDRNPYAYVQPYYDVEILSKKIEEISRIEGSGEEMPIHFLTPEYWPMPFYLRKFKNIGYWENNLPQRELTTMPLIITTPEKVEIQEKLAESHHLERRHRLPGYELLVFYRNDLWFKYLDKVNFKEQK